MSLNLTSPLARSTVVDRWSPDSAEALTSLVSSWLVRVTNPFWAPPRPPLSRMLTRVRTSRLYCRRDTADRNDAAASWDLSGAKSSPKNNASLAWYHSSGNALMVAPCPDIDVLAPLRSHAVPKWCMVNAAIADLYVPGTPYSTVGGLVTPSTAR